MSKEVSVKMVKIDMNWDDRTGMKMSVDGRDVNCWSCGLLVPSGYSHECNTVGGKLTARTWKTGQPELGSVNSRLPSFDQPGPRVEPETKPVPRVDKIVYSKSEVKRRKSNAKRGDAGVLGKKT